MTEHEVFICYDNEDKKAADAACQCLEDNDIKCWLKSRDAKIGHEIEDTMESIRQSEAMVLIFSEYCKISEHVRTEVNFAFNEGIQIIAFKAEDAELEGMAYFLRNAHFIDAFQGNDDRFENLVRDTSKFLDKPVSDISISDNVKNLGKESDEYVRTRPKPKVDKPGFFDRHKKAIVVVLAILVIGVCIFAFMNYDDGIGGTSEAESSLPNITMNISDFHVDDVRKEDVAWNFSYIVSGTISPAPDDGNYRIIVDFYDKTGKLIETTETPFNDAEKVSSGYLFGSAVSDKNNIKSVEVQLINENNIVVAQCGDKL